MALRLPRTLQTPRLLLRAWRISDVADALAYATDPEWGRFLPLPSPYLESDAERFIASQLLLDWETHPSWALEHEGRGVGGFNLRLSEDGRIAELGYSVARSCWGRGFGTEAARAVVGAAFEHLPALGRVRAMANAENVASCRVLEKLGFQREGTLRANRFIRGLPVDEAWFGVLRDEWTAQ